MSTKSIRYTDTELQEKEDHKTKRYPNLNTVLMVEKALQDNKEEPMVLSKLKQKLPKKIMHQTLKVILEYLWYSGKIIYGPKGIQWIYAESEHLKKMFKDTLEM